MADVMVVPIATDQNRSHAQVIVPVAKNIVCLY